MQHLDEGRLQAWLDRARSGMDEAERGAIERHLAECETCSGRLAELDGETTRVEALLSAPGQAREIPEWESVVARSHARTAPTRRRPIWRSVGWAAGIAAIMGAGWLSNDLFRRVDPARPVAPSAATEASPARSRVAEKSAADETGSPAGTPAEVGSRTAAARPADIGPQTAAATPADAPLAAEAKGETPTPAPTRTAQVAEALSDIPQPAAPVLPTTQPGAVAPTTFEDVRSTAPSRARLDRIAATPKSSLLRGRVTDEAGQPLASAQVAVQGTNLGTLTNQNGAFALALPDTAPTAVGRDVTLTAQLIGYGLASRNVLVRAGDTVSADLSLPQQRIALDEIVVTGASAETADAGIATPFSTAGGPWTTMDRAEAALRVGFLLRTVVDLPVVDVAVGSVEGVPAVRIVQELGGGNRLTLLETKGVAPFRDRPVPDGSGWSVASTQRGDVWITATAPIPVDSLNALLERVR